MEAIAALNDARLMFEIELLQHCKDLDVLLVRGSEDGAVSERVELHLPLFDDALAGVPDDDVIPRTRLLHAFQFPPQADPVSTTALSIQLPLKSNRRAAPSLCAIEDWVPVLHWPGRGMELSRQVTALPQANTGFTSTIDLVRVHCDSSGLSVSLDGDSPEASCVTQNLMRHWTQRKTLVQELRECAIVLEFDAIDFAHVVFLVQEEVLSATDPAFAALRICMLRLQFTPEFYLSGNARDLVIVLLDGEPTNGEGNATSGEHRLDLPARETMMDGNGDDATSLQQLSASRFLDDVHEALGAYFA
ncbi:TPA: hypothetical protein N0F65_003373 [Lagenidium giganteum]|uniref:Uncharacterized protein n=1 Tax=Lagenidium giganteum TaxID=4803 RepID=A0AAV2Z9Y6_9STRA|nr:TPA: hypothetical protein N0F65_003373 [Lagenidium giganteum]